MNHADVTARIGAFLSILVFIHFAVDWIFQTHAEAMAKHNNWKVRARHCAIYTTPFIPFLLWIGVPVSLVFASAGILFISHFVEDMYLPVFYWAKWIRRPPSMRWNIEYRIDGPRLVDPDGKWTVAIYRIDQPPRTWREDILEDVAVGRISDSMGQNALDKRGFLEFIDGTLGKILMIAIDQIIHIAFLLPVAWMAAKAH